MNNIKLTKLYAKTSKHSHYQILATPLRELIKTDDLGVCSRYEEERLHYICTHIPYNYFTLVDIGANTGYFTLELMTKGASSAVVVEGNSAHADFVSAAVNVLNWQAMVEVSSEYVQFNESSALINTDVLLLLNVLHHVGDDYNNEISSISSAKTCILASLRYLAKKTKYLIFQLGFNWKGDKNLPLFSTGTKAELINFIKEGTINDWNIEHIGIAQKHEERVVYEELDTENIERQDALGEFLNRPLFIMRSTQFY
jgi:hypothetical protein